MDLSKESADIIRQWSSRLTAPASVRLQKTADDRSQQFLEFAEALTRLAPGIDLVTEQESQEKFPAFLMKKSWRFHLVPQGAELRPFLELIEMIAQDRAGISESVKKSLESIRSPSLIKIFVTSYCPHCQRTVNLIKPLPIINPLIKITFIDGQLFPELARADKVRSVPTVICNEQFRWVGQMQIEELIQVMGQHDPELLGKEVLKSMIKNGDAAKLAEMMVEKQQIFPAFLDILMDQEWPARLGAMVAFEQLADLNPVLAQKALEPLWEKLPAAEENVKGDMLYLFGKAGDATWVSRLTHLTSSEHPVSLREAAREALVALKEKEQP